MKKIKQALLVLLAVVATNITTNAQSIDNYNDYVKYGIKGGVNLANLRGVDRSVKTGVSVGMFAEYPLSLKLGFRSELNFSVQGAKAVNGIQQVKLNYLNWPLLARYYASEKLSLEAGPQLGFLLSGSGGSLPKSAYKTLDFSLGFGAGYNLTKELELNARYNFGLTDITKTPGSIKNSVFQFTLAYSF